MSNRILSALLLACSFGLAACVDLEDPDDVGRDPEVPVEELPDEVLDVAELPSSTQPTRQVRVPTEPVPGDVLDVEDLPTDRPGRTEVVPTEPAPGDVLIGE